MKKKGKRKRRKVGSRELKSVLSLLRRKIRGDQPNQAESGGGVKKWSRKATPLI
jgi:hypothetical protein